MKPLPLLLATLMLVGCVRFEPQPISPAATAAQLDARRLDDAGLKHFAEQQANPNTPAWPPAEWDLHSLTLVAFYFHPSLEVARAQWRTAQAGITTAGERPNPTLGLTPGYNFSAASGVNPWMPGINLDVPIETAGKRGKRQSEARHLSESARWKIVSAAWQIRSGVRASLLELTTAERRANLLERQVTRQEEAMQQLRQRQAAGALAAAELTSAQIALSKAQLELADAQLQAAATRSQLAESLGVTTTALAGVRFSFDLNSQPAENLTSDQARDLALQQRADIRSALAEYAATEDELRLQIAKQYPDVHLNPGYQFDQGEHKWSVGLTLDLPILSQNRGPIAEAEAKRSEQAARFSELQAKVSGEIERALAAYAASQKSAAHLAGLANAQRSQQQAVEQQFKAGVTDRTERLAAEIEAGAAELTALEAQMKSQQAVGALEDALQLPLEVAAAVQETHPVQGKESSK